MNAFPKGLGHCLAALLSHLLLLVVAPAQDVATDVADLLRLKDDVDAAVITRIAASKSREGAEGLVKAYEVCGSILMRREIVRALAKFDGADEAEKPALGKIASVATTAEEPELREAALLALGASPQLGRHFLRQIVDSEASDLVREPALREHIRMATAEDAEWYRFLWNLKQEQRKDKDGNIRGAELTTVRLLAFTGVAAFLSEEELIDALRRDIDPKIRRKALGAMSDRKMNKTAEMADWVLKRVDFTGADRIEAARILIERDGAKAVPAFLELAKKRDVTQEDLRNEMAKMIAGLADEGVQKRIAKLVGKGKPHERVFALTAASRQVEPKQLEKELANSALEVRRAAANVIMERGMRELLPTLHDMLKKGKNPSDQRFALEAISAIEKGSDAWLDELAGYTTHADQDVRNTAIEQIGIGRYKKQIDVLAACLQNADWSTRFAAVEALTAMKHKSVIPLLIEQMKKDPGRMGKRIGEILWQFTAQPFQEDYERWTGWWKEAGDTFEIVGESELNKAEKAREMRRLTQRTKAPAKFFGLEIESHKVIFVIDVSGSMIESMYGRYVGKRGAARIDVARQEVIQAINNLDSAALFNVFAFSSGVEKWQKSSSGTNNEASRKAAITWVERLGASGATNLYDSIEEAFADPDVDTIYLMSDGEPTSGAVIDPHRIREDVAFWNKHRKIVIHTVAIGGNLEILEWIAEDSGGKHVKMR